MKNLVLIGFMGSGKSTVGRLAAAELDMPFVDMDRRIEEQEGCSITEIFARKGEPAFRDLESGAVDELAKQDSTVIAAGGGVVVRPSNIEKLARNGVLIFLRVDAETAVARTRGHTHRPLLAKGDSVERVRALLRERQPLYEGIPIAVESTGRAIQEIVRDVVRIYRSHAKERKNS